MGKKAQPKALRLGGLHQQMRQLELRKLKHSDKLVLGSDKEKVHAVRDGFRFRTAELISVAEASSQSIPDTVEIGEQGRSSTVETVLKIQRAQIRLRAESMKLEGELAGLDDAVEAAEQELLDTKRRIGGHNAPVIEARKGTANVARLEARLEKAKVTYNNKLGQCKKLVEVIDALKRGRLVFDQVVANLTSELESKKLLMQTAISESDDSFFKRDKCFVEVTTRQKECVRLIKALGRNWDTQVTALKKQQHIEQAEFEAQFRERERRASVALRKKGEALARRTASAVSNGSSRPSSGFHSSRSYLRQQRELEQKQAQLDETQTRCEELREHVRQIEQGIGISLEELTTRLYTADKRNYSLFSRVSEYEATTERLREELSNRTFEHNTEESATNPKSPQAVRRVRRLASDTSRHGDVLMRRVLALRVAKTKAAEATQGLLPVGTRDNDSAVLQQIVRTLESKAKDAAECASKAINGDGVTGTDTAEQCATGDVGWNMGLQRLASPCQERSFTFEDEDAEEQTAGNLSVEIKLQKTTELPSIWLSTNSVANYSNKDAQVQKLEVPPMHSSASAVKLEKPRVLEATRKPKAALVNQPTSTYKKNPADTKTSRSQDKPSVAKPQSESKSADTEVSERLYPDPNEVEMTLCTVVAGEKNGDFQTDAETLRAAMKGLGTDEDAIVSLLSSRSFEQRIGIQRAYGEKFNRDLLTDLKSELSGDLEMGALALFKDVATLHAHMLREAMSGAGTNENSVLDTLISAAAFKCDVASAYNQEFNRDLLKDLESEMKSDGRRLVSVLQAATSVRSAERGLTKDEVEQHVTNMDALQLLSKEARSTLRCVASAYQSDIAAALVDSLTDENTDGHEKQWLTAFVDRTLLCARDSNAFFLQQFARYCDGHGTDEHALANLKQLRLSDTLDAELSGHLATLMKALAE
ncbi:MAG: hypothetical protein MHM6MM_003349 [Cercozoa sp. M6MM]